MEMAVKTTHKYNIIKELLYYTYIKNLCGRCEQKIKYIYIVFE